ncbi:unnamed protein product [Rhizoctonia solani]|uniref:PNPLA domain-containing protein n=1 Tax=Rhizoctonia solani TaxID=456999 RepID=A0A8H3DY43_9AGAM|nr:unnamed protein product [Rhizoctonia solani]
MSDGITNQRGFRLLSLDDGGIKGLSSLYIIQEMMHRLRGQLAQETTGMQPHEIPLPKPCDYFDFIAGVGTGAICAVMLGRLRMGINEAIQAYANLMTTVFSDPKLINRNRGAFKAHSLETELKKLVKNVEGDEDEMLFNSRELHCKVIVYAMSSHNLNDGLPTSFYSYPPRTGSTTECKIWEALRATTSYPEMFKGISVDINGTGVAHRFDHGGLGCSNPTRVLFEEASQLDVNRRVELIVSIGTGHPETIRIAGGQSSGSTMQRVLEASRRMAEGSEQVAEEMQRRFANGEPKYYRLNVQQGLQGVDAREWGRLDEVAANAGAYLRKSEVSLQLDALVARLHERPNLAIASGSTSAAAHRPRNDVQRDVPRPRRALTDKPESGRPDLAAIATVLGVRFISRLKRRANATAERR